MTSEFEAPVLLSVEEGVALITLNRPERQNAWTPAMTAHYAAALVSASRDPAVRVIVVTGAGDHFCPGGDGEAISDVAKSGAGLAVSNPEPPWLALSIGKPVIAAIRGVCFGYGLFQALCCDIRFAGEDAKFSTAYARRGLVAEMGMSWLLPRAIGSGRAADLLFSARLVRADEAERMGLVSRVVPAGEVLEAALSYARTMAAQTSSHSLRSMKLQLYTDMMSTFSEAFKRAETLLTQATASDDFKEGVKSWLEKRAPNFAPLPEDLARFDIC